MGNIEILTKESMDDFLDFKNEMEYNNPNVDVNRIEKEEFDSLVRLSKEPDVDPNSIEFVYSTEGSPNNDEINLTDTENKKMLILNFFSLLKKEIPTIDTLQEYYEWFIKEDK